MLCHVRDVTAPQHVGHLVYILMLYVMAKTEIEIYIILIN
jgi:hypothetical protein